MLCMLLSLLSSMLFMYIYATVGHQLTFSSRYDLKQMLAKSPISRVPEELRKHEAAQSKPTRGMGKKIEESSGFGGKGGWS